MEKRQRQLYQYKNSTNFNRFLDALYSIVAAASPQDLINFLDVDNAVGAWLTQLADIFNVPRSYCALGSAFVLDYSTLDGPDVFDGGLTPIADDVLRALLKARIYRNTAQVKSLDYMYTVWNNVVKPVDIHIVEGTKALTLNVTFVTGSDAYRLYTILVSLDNKWFGVPCATSVTYAETLI